MPRVICELDNASTSINGIAFAGEPGHMVSEEVSDDIAATLATIPGFRIAEPPAPGQDSGEGDTDAAKKAAAKRAKPSDTPPAS